VLHLVDEGRCLTHEVQNLVGVAFSVHLQVEVVHGERRQEVADGVHRKINRYNFVVLLNLHVTCVSLEELVDWRLGERRNLLADFGQNDGELVDEDEYVEALNDTAFEGVFG